MEFSETLGTERESLSFLKLGFLMDERGTVVKFLWPLYSAKSLQHFLEVH